MIYLLVSIVSMCMFMLLLKLFAVKGWNIPQAILINYIIATTIGIMSYKGEVNIQAIFGNDWWYLALFSGMLFFFSSDIMALSTKWAGMAVTTIASRTALVIPIIYSVLFLHEGIGVWEVAGVTMIIAAMVMIFYAKSNISSATKRVGKWEKAKTIILPLLVFASMGAITICMKSTQYIVKESGNYETDYPMFQIITFISALVCGAVYYSLRIGRKAFVPDIKSSTGGLFIGGFNYLVTLSILLALNVLSTSVFYASYNISVVILSAIISVVIFKEKLTMLKIVGICVAIIAIAILLLLR